MYTHAVTNEDILMECGFHRKNVRIAVVNDRKCAAIGCEAFLAIVVEYAQSPVRLNHVGSALNLHRKLGSRR